MRGSKYFFVNSLYLQNKLKELGIQYIYVKELSPTQDIRKDQIENDKKSGVTKQARRQLSKTFVERYNSECLAKFDLFTFIKQFKGNSKLLFFCVEEHPDACHRSLVTHELQNFPGVEIHHITGK